MKNSMAVYFNIYLFIKTSFKFCKGHDFINVLSSGILWGKTATWSVFYSRDSYINIILDVVINKVPLLTVKVFIH